jgi:nucleoid-associated protein YgaU
MTSDAKIGLLLGLVFIFIIAFVVNGLPGFLRGKPSNDLTTEVVKGSEAKPIAQMERQISAEVTDQNVPYRMSVSNNPQISNVRQTTGGVAGVQPAVDASGTTGRITNIVTVSPPGRITANDANSRGAVQNMPVVKEQAKTYAVAEGDSLASIAIKFYGAKEGNRKANIEKIFEANRNILKSVDEIYVGQKLVIPVLQIVQSSTAKSLSEHPALEKVPSVGARHLDQKQQSKGGVEYVVAEGDSLWKIAAEKLGDGNRYKEITALNKDVLSSEDSLSVGMKLKLPAK